MSSLFVETGDIAYLHEAITCSREALSLQDIRHPTRLRSLGNLAIFLRMRHLRLGDTAHIQGSVKLLQESLFLPGNQGDTIMTVLQLGSTLGNRYDALGDPDDLDESIRLLRDASNSFPLGHPRRSAALNDLGDALQVRFRRDRKVDDSAEAIYLLRESISLSSTGASEQGRAIFDLVEALSAYFRDTRHEECLEEALTLCDTWLTRSQDKYGSSTYFLRLYHCVTSVIIAQRTYPRRS